MTFEYAQLYFSFTFHSTCLDVKNVCDILKTTKSVNIVRNYILH